MKKTTFALAKGKTISYKSEELGQYRVKYFFNTTLGYVRWECSLPNNEKIILQLK